MTNEEMLEKVKECKTVDDLFAMCGQLTPEFFQWAASNYEFTQALRAIINKEN